MKKGLKKLLCTALSMAMIAGSIVLPNAASAETTPIFEGDTVEQEWKFDFGAAGSTPEEGFTLVTPDKNYETDKDYGFLGISEESHKFGERADGFGNQEGQIIELEASESGIGSVGEDLYGNAGDIYYPTRFTIKADDESYYRVRATVTTLDSEQNAKISLYTERKHPIFTEKTVNAGDEVTVEFTVRPTPIYYEKSDPKGAIADGMVNVAVLGDNSALAKLEIQKVTTAPVLWVLGDSTVTDGNCALPFFPLQNYTGVGTGLTKYLPSNFAMVNEGEGGLNANDNNHFNMVKSRIKDGDYLYVEYGHNHKNSDTQDFTSEYWMNNYISALPKYYEACKAVGATLVIVGPIDRHNATQYESSTNTWSSTLSNFSNLGEDYIQCLKYGGETAASSLLSKWSEISAEAEEHKVVTKDEKGKIHVTTTVTPELTQLKEEAEQIVEDAVALGGTQIEKVAFVDLNAPSLEWLSTVSAKGTVGGVELTNDPSLTNFYFTTLKKGSTDGTHPNDTGAENLAYYFFTTADKEEYPILTPLLANFEDGATHELPTPVSPEIMNMGAAGQSDAWPQYLPMVQYEYPMFIKDVKLNENNQFVSMDVQVQATFANYALGVVEIYDENDEIVKTFTTSGHIDNTTGTGLNTLLFDTVNPVTLEEGQSFKAYTWSCDMTEDALIPEEEGGEQLSSIYEPTDIEQHFMFNEDGEATEDFYYYGAVYEGDEVTSLGGKNLWDVQGSSGHDLTLGKNGDMYYTNVAADGNKTVDGVVQPNQGSFYLARPFGTGKEDPALAIGTTGKYIVDFEMKYALGGGAKFQFSDGFGNKSPFVGETLDLFELADGGDLLIGGQSAGKISGTDFTNVRYTLDMDRATASLSVAGGTPVTVTLDNYDTTDIEVNPKQLTHFVIQSNKVAFAFQMTNLTVAKLKDQTLPKYTLNVESNGTGGSVYTYLAGEDIEGSDDLEQTLAETTLKYENGNAVITSTVAQETVLIEAIYDGSELASVKTTPVLLNGTDAVTVPASAGSKLMLWNSLENMEPIAVIEKAGISTDSLTAEINTQVTVDAQANDGYVFVGWTNEDGTTVSTDALYTFRLRGNTTLTAQFAEQGGVEDVTSFVVAADKTKMPTGTDQTVTLTLSDVVDEEGNAVEYNSDTDVTWSCGDDQVTVEKGIVTIPASYTGESFKNIVPVTCTINNIEKTVNLTLYSTDYYEDFSAVTDFSEWISNSGTTTNAFEVLNTAESNDFVGMKAEGNGSVMVIGSGANGEGKMLAYDRDLDLSDYTTLKFGFDIEPYQIRTDGKNASVTLQFVDSDGTKVFDVLVNTAGKNSSFNGTEVAGFTQGTVVSVDTEFDFSAKTMKYTLTNSAGIVPVSYTHLTLPTT